MAGQLRKPILLSFSDDTGILGDHVTSDSTVALTGAADPNVSVTLYDGAAAVGTATADSTGGWVIEVGLSHGSHDLSAQASDGLGNTSPLSDVFTIVIDAPPASAVSDVALPHGQTSVSASALFTMIDPDGDALVEYQIWNQGPGHFQVAGQALPVGSANVVSAAQLAQTVYIPGSAADTVRVRAFDGTLWSNWSNAFSVNPPPNHAPQIAVVSQSVELSHTQSAVSIASLFTVSDADQGDNVVQYDVWFDGHGGGHLLYNGNDLSPGGGNVLTPAQLAQLTFQVGASADTVWVRASDGYSWGSWSLPVSIKQLPNRAPIVSGAQSSVVVAKGQTSITVSDFFVGHDPDTGDAITQYDVWDAGAGGGQLLFNGGNLAAGTDNYIPAAQLGQLTYRVGTATDTLWLRAFDGSLWGAWSAISVVPPVDHAPIVSIVQSTVALNHGQTAIAVSPLFTATDPDPVDSVLLYDLWNAGGVGGHFSLQGQSLGVNTHNYLTAAQVGQLSYEAGAGTGTVWVRASDGDLWSAWSPAIAILPPVDHAPTIGVVQASVTPAHGQTTIPLAGLFSAADSDVGDIVTQYDVWNAGTGGGRLLLNGQPLGASRDNYVTAGQLAQLAYQTGSGTDTVWMRASDGTLWSKWSSAVTINQPLDNVPVVTALVSNAAPPHAQTTITVSTLFAATDVDQGDTISKYDVWYSGKGGGQLKFGNVVLPAAGDNYLTPSQFAQLSYQTGGASDTIWVRASDGLLYSPWSAGVTLSPAPNHAPVVAIPNPANVSLGPGLSAVLLSSLVFATDADQGDAIVEYDVWNTGQGGGHFVLGNQSLGAGQHNYLTAGQFAQLSYQTGSSTDTLWVRASDGVQYGAWSASFGVTATPISSPTQTLSVPEGATLTIGAPYSGIVQFLGSTGTLILSSASSFGGAVANLSGDDAVDFTNIVFATHQAPQFSGSTSGGTLTLSDGTHTDAIHLIGDFTQSAWIASDDGHGGTIIVDPKDSTTVPGAGGLEDGQQNDHSPSNIANLQLLTSYMASTFNSSAALNSESLSSPANVTAEQGILAQAHA